jgi:hypothetical protein
MICARLEQVDHGSSDIRPFCVHLLDPEEGINRSFANLK